MFIPDEGLYNLIYFFQNLELPSIAQSHATLLLDAALDRCSWDLARELVRFLRTIGIFCFRIFTIYCCTLQRDSNLNFWTKRQQT